MKKKVEKAKRAWVDKLSYIFWALRATKKSTTIETLFLLTYNVDMVIPIDVGARSLSI